MTYYVFIKVYRDGDNVAKPEFGYVTNVDNSNLIRAKSVIMGDWIDENYDGLMDGSVKDVDYFDTHTPNYYLGWTTNDIGGEAIAEITDFSFLDEVS